MKQHPYCSDVNQLTGVCLSNRAKICARMIPSTTFAVTVEMAAGEIAVISKRAVDSALLVNGATCVDVVPTTPVTALTTKLKTIAVQPKVAAALDASDEVVLLDIRNGTFALAGASSGGITIDLGTGAGTDELAVLGATAADKLGCKVVSTKDALGLKSATSADVKFTNTVAKFTVDLNDGDDTFDQGDCTTGRGIQRTFDHGRAAPRAFVEPSL